MRRREKEKEKTDSLISLHYSEEFNAALGSNVNVNGNGCGSPISKISSAVPGQKTAVDHFLNLENEKSDYDWLLTPPGTPLLPSLEKESQKNLISQIEVSNSRPTALKTRLANLLEGPASKSTLASKQQTSSEGLNSSSTRNKRPTSSGGPKSASRPATPTARPTLLTGTKPSRSSTPTTRATLPSKKPAAFTARSLIPTRSTARSSTQTVKPSLPASKLISRSATPTRQPASSSSVPIAPAPTSRSSSVPKSAPTTSSVPKSAPITSPVKKSNPATSSVTKSVPTTSKNSVPSQDTSPTFKSRPSKTSEMPERPGKPSVRSSSVEASSKGRARRQSCSPARSRASSGSVWGNGSSIRSVRRADTSGSDNESPVVIGTKMVERVVNMRKLVPPRQDNNPRNTAKLSTSIDWSGFGRTLSKKSLDMAMRHMDIRRNVSGNERPLMTKTNDPASSIYTVRSGYAKSWTTNACDSPVATSSDDASSESSVIVNNNNSLCIDEVQRKTIKLKDHLSSETAMVEV